MAARDPKTEKGEWKTINGVHVFIREGESATDALNRTIAKNNEDIKAKQIAENKARADEFNGKSTTNTNNTLAYALKNNNHLQREVMEFSRANRKNDNEFIKGDLKLSDDAYSSADKKQFEKDIKQYLQQNFPNLDYSLTVRVRKDGTWLNIKNNRNSGKLI